MSRIKTVVITVSIDLLNFTNELKSTVGIHGLADRERQFSQKSICTRYLTAFCTNCVGDGDPGMAHVLKGTWFYRMFIALVLYVHILAARAYQQEDGMKTIY